MFRTKDEYHEAVLVWLMNTYEWGRTNEDLQYVADYLDPNLEVPFPVDRAFQLQEAVASV